MLKCGDSMSKPHRIFRNSIELSVLKTFGACDGSKNFTFLFPYYKRILFYTDMIESIEWQDRLGAPFIQIAPKKIHPRHFHPKTGSSTDIFIHTLSSKIGFIQKHFHPKSVSSKIGFIQIGPASPGPPSPRRPSPGPSSPGFKAAFHTNCAFCFSGDIL